MPTPTYRPLANITLTTATASVTFGSIPATYRDLVIVVENASTTSEVRLTINNDSTTNYFFQIVRADSGGVVATQSSLGSFAITDLGGFGTMTIMDYSATDKHKTMLRMRNMRSVQDRIDLAANRWGSTAAITTLRFALGTGNLAVGTTFALYGIEG